MTYIYIQDKRATFVDIVDEKLQCSTWWSTWCAMDNSQLTKALECMLEGNEFAVRSTFTVSSMVDTFIEDNRLVAIETEPTLEEDSRPIVEALRIDLETALKKLDNIVWQV